jgi:hypothetical protein
MVGSSAGSATSISRMFCVSPALLDSAPSMGGGTKNRL